jgi:hypothetical protein
MVIHLVNIGDEKEKNERHEKMVFSFFLLFFLSLSLYPVYLHRSLSYFHCNNSNNNTNN